MLKLCLCTATVFAVALSVACRAEAPSTPPHATSKPAPASTTATAAMTAAESSPTSTAPTPWRSDFAAAMAEATAARKGMLLLFTGSDWCPPCRQLDEAVFSKPDFAAATTSHVLVKLDFPRNSELSASERAQNDALYERYQIEGFPTTVFTDGAGRVIARMGGRQPDSVEEYLLALTQVDAMRTERDRLLGEAAKATGATRAALLDQAISGQGDIIILDGYEAEAKVIAALDGDENRALRSKYSTKLAQQEVMPVFRQLQRAMESTDATAAAMVCEKALEKPTYSAAARQHLIAMHASLLHDMGVPLGQIVTRLNQAVAADPSSELAENLKAAMVRLREEETQSASATAAAGVSAEAAPSASAAPTR